MRAKTLRHVQSVGLYASLVGVGWGLGVIWTAAITMTAAPSAPPLWLIELLPRYRSFATAGAAILLAGTLVVFAVEDLGLRDSDNPHEDRVEADAKQ